ncbi:hypothetical protein ACKKBF_B04670 [Auxenochlorella protothecoides x Auxenochlorella symbiontica]
MYRCLRANAKCAEALPPAVRSAFREVAAKPAREVNLPEELRSLLVSCAKSLEPPRRRLFSSQSTSVSCGALTFKDVWVDFGLRHFSMSIPAKPEEDGLTAMVDILDIPYEDVASLSWVLADCQPPVQAAAADLRVDLKRLPQDLESLLKFGNEDSRHRLPTLCLGLAKDFHQRIREDAPAVAGALATSGLLPTEACAPIRTPLPDVSQGPRKVSWGTSVYRALPLRPSPHAGSVAGMPSGLGEAPAPCPASPGRARQTTQHGTHAGSGGASRTQSTACCPPSQDEGVDDLGEEGEGVQEPAAPGNPPHLGLKPILEEDRDASLKAASIFTTAEAPKKEAREPTSKLAPRSRGKSQGEIVDPSPEPESRLPQGCVLRAKPTTCLSKGRPDAPRPCTYDFLPSALARADVPVRPGSPPLAGGAVDAGIQMVRDPPAARRTALTPLAAMKRSTPPKEGQQKHGEKRNHRSHPTAIDDRERPAKKPCQEGVRAPAKRVKSRAPSKTADKPLKQVLGGGKRGRSIAAAADTPRELAVAVTRRQPARASKITAVQRKARTADSDQESASEGRGTPEDALAKKPRPAAPVSSAPPIPATSALARQVKPAGKQAQPQNAGTTNPITPTLITPALRTADEPPGPGTVPLPRSIAAVRGRVPVPRVDAPIATAVPPARPSPPRGTPAAPHAPTARIGAGTGLRRHGPTPPLPSALGVQPLPAPIVLSPVRKLRFTPSKRDLRWELSSDGEDGGEESEAEQEGEGELGLAALMRQALCVKKARRRASIASSQSSEGQGDSETEEAGMAQLQAALMGILRRRKAGAAKKRAALLEALEQDTAERLSSLQAQAAEERRGLEAQAQRALHELTGRMEAKYQELVAAHEQYVAAGRRMWEEYQHLHDQASTVNEEASAALARQEESTARRLTELKAWTQQQQAAARRKIAKARKQAAKLPQLASMLLPFM